MKNRMFIPFVVLLLILPLGCFTSCKNKNPSVLKVYVRSASNELVEGATVVIIGDQSSNPPTLAYVDTAITATGGYVEFDMQPYFDTAGEKEHPTGYFDIITKKNTKEGEGNVRCRVHMTAVETVYFPD